MFWSCCWSQKRKNEWKNKRRKIESSRAYAHEGWECIVFFVGIDKLLYIFQAMRTFPSEKIKTMNLFERKFSPWIHSLFFFYCVSGTQRTSYISQPWLANQKKIKINKITPQTTELHLESFCFCCGLNDSVAGSRFSFACVSFFFFFLFWYVYFHHNTV